MYASSRTSANPVAPLLLTPEQAADALGVGRTTVYALIRDGELRSVRLGRSRRIPYASLVAYVDHLDSFASEPA